MSRVRSPPGKVELIRIQITSREITSRGRSKWCDLVQKNVGVQNGVSWQLQRTSHLDSTYMASWGGASDDAARLTFVRQTEARGYVHAIWCARGFVQDEPFLHFVGDHIYVSSRSGGSARHLVEAAMAISAVQVTHESLLPRYGAVGGQQVPGKPGLYRVDKVLEKPTPTQAEQHLIVPGLHYLEVLGLR
jgi:UTP-glucose-1-phosphate uridylyltransferase